MALQATTHPRANLDAPLVASEAIAAGYVVLTFAHAVVARHGQPGQYVMLKAGTSAEPPLRRPFSILDTDRATGSFRVFLKIVGGSSGALARLRPGETAQCLGPLGQPFAAPASAAEEALLVAGGFGIAPLLFFARELKRQVYPARVFYGGRSATDIVLGAPFEALGVPLVVNTDDGSLGVRGRVTEPLRAHIAAGRGRYRLYGCGPDAMLHALARLAEQAGVPAQVSLDPWMGCGLGTCLGCVVRIQHEEEPRPRYRCACTEGPVFDAACVLWPGEQASFARRKREVL